MRSELRVGLIGGGAMGEGHLACWDDTTGAQVTAVCDANPERAQAAAQTRSLKAFTDLDSMLDSGLVDAVDICTPSGLHADQGIAAARRGLHVLCEKPLDLNIDKAD